MDSALNTVNISRTNTGESGGYYDGPIPEPDERPKGDPSDTPITPIEVLKRPEDSDHRETVRSESVIDQQLIERLTAVADTVAAVLGTDPPRSVQGQLNAWYDLHGFDTTGTANPLVVVARQATLNLLLKATLYEHHHQQGRLPPLPNDTQRAFRRANDQLETPAFEEYVLDDVIAVADEELRKTVIDERNRLRQSTQPAEDIGQLYEALTPKDGRRVLGQHHTPAEIGTLMRRWTTTGGDVVLDPGMGAGVLTSPFHPRWILSTEPANVDGIDCSHLSVLMGTTALTLAGQPHDARARDFLALGPEDLPTDIDAIVCNPPYTRHQELPPAYKEELQAQVREETGVEVTKTSPLYAYFIYHARQFLDPGARASFIVPQSFLAADYGEPLKQFLLDAFDIKAILQFTPGSEAVFSDALTTSLITFLEARGAEPPDTTRFIRVDSDPGDRTLRDAAREGTEGETDWGFINCLHQENLSPQKNWQSLLNPCDIDTGNLNPLSEIATISRGLSTGENDFFCLSQDEVEQWNIKEAVLSPLLRSPRHVSGYDFRGADWDHYRAADAPVWLLYHTADVEGVPERIDNVDPERTDSPNPAGVADPNPGVSAYLRAGLTDHETLPTRSIIQDRDPWYRVERREPAPILVPSMRRSGFRAILNETDARHLNNFYGVEPDDSLTRMDLKALLAYLNSPFLDDIVRQHARTYAGGLDKLEPGDLKELPVIDPRELSDDVVQSLAAKFDELRATVRHDDDTDGDTVLRQIDSILKREL